MRRQDSFDSQISMEDLMDELYGEQQSTDAMEERYGPPHARQLMGAQTYETIINSKKFPKYGLQSYGRSAIVADRVPFVGQIVYESMPYYAINAHTEAFRNLKPLKRIANPPEGIPESRQYAHGKGMKGGNVIEDEDSNNTMMTLHPTGFSFETSPPTEYHFDRSSEAGVAYGAPGIASPSNVSEEYDKFAFRTLNDLWSGSRVPHFQDLAHAAYHQYYPDDGTLGQRAGREFSRVLAEVGAIPNDIYVINDAEAAFRHFYAGQRNILDVLEGESNRSVRRHRRRAAPGVNVVEDDDI